MMNILQIIQTVADEIGDVERPNAIVGNTNENVIQLLALANREGKELVKYHIWSPLTKEAFITTVAAQEAYPLPSDFDRFIDNTMWDRDNRRHVNAGDTPQGWQWRKSFQVANEFWRHVRIRGTSANNFLIYPVPGTSGNELHYEYISKNWVKDNLSTEKDRFTVDDDTHVFDDDLLILGIIWRFRKAKGFDYADAYKEYQARRGNIVSSDGGGAPYLYMGKATYTLPEGNIPDGNWPGA